MRRIAGSSSTISTRRTERGVLIAGRIDGQCRNSGVFAGAQRLRAA
jgi:hypothetical protein